MVAAIAAQWQQSRAGAAQERGELRAAPPPDGLIRVFIAIYQGLALQTAWDADLDHDAYVRAVEVIVDALT